MDSGGQLAYFFVCVTLGVAGGGIYEVFSLFLPPTVVGKHPKKAVLVLRFCADVAFFIVFAALCIFALNRLCFPAFREYYYLGFGVGLLLYLKTFHKAVDFFKFMCYNGIQKLVNCAKSRKNFRKKEEKRL